ncbi:MAG TPA: MaoC family dehydratase, partial [Candidatus Dormibacteraeota bacterium]|nr:MaoC family dehydratase [Candidatus Dormibacteraeota bacterium]
MNSTEVIRRTAAISKNRLPGSKSPQVNARGREVDLAILGPDLEPISFDDLPLGGEWTTRRRTISESEIALFAAVAGDFSPLTIDAVHSGTRFAPPALLVAMAVGLGTMDMPVPSIAEWEWLNWKFPRPVRAGETIYARWTLTQKRPPMGGAPTAIVVWRVDVHTADGA